MRQKAAILMALALSLPTFCSDEVKIRIEAPALDKPKLLADLNAQGNDHGLHFVLEDNDYDYRVTFSIGQSTGMSSGSTSSFNSASAEVYDSAGGPYLPVVGKCGVAQARTVTPIVARLNFVPIRWQCCSAHRVHNSRVPILSPLLRKGGRGPRGGIPPSYQVVTLWPCAPLKPSQTHV